MQQMQHQRSAAGAALNALTRVYIIGVNSLEGVNAQKVLSSMLVGFIDLQPQRLQTLAALMLSSPGLVHRPGPQGR